MGHRNYRLLVRLDHRIGIGPGERSDLPDSNKASKEGSSIRLYVIYF